MTAYRPRRSVLYMPGSNARALEKAKTLDADALILDLEDAVAPDAKDMARDQVRDAVVAGGYGHREMIIRINAPDTDIGERDLWAAIGAKPDAILIPKVSSPEVIAEVGRTMAGAGNETTRIWAMIETPAAIINIADIGRMAVGDNARLDCFVMGTNDLIKETRARFTSDRLPLVGWLSTTVAAARAFGIDIVDGVFNSVSDADGFLAECEQGRDLGMDGKTLIHPNQIAPCNAVFSPSEGDIDEAKAIVAAFELPENADKGAIKLNGRMVERLHAEMAARTVAVADAIAGRIGANTEEKSG